MDPCACSADGVSGGVATGRRGCAPHDFPVDLTVQCYVVGGAAFARARPTGSCPGAYWRTCTPAGLGGVS